VLLFGLGAPLTVMVRSQHLMRHDYFDMDAKQRGEENLIQGDFGEAWLEVLAAGSGVLHGRPSTLDLEKADVELILQGEFNNTYNPTLKAQVKTISEPFAEIDEVSYDLDVKTHNVLCRTDHSVRRVLIVISAPNIKERVRLTDEGLLLLARGLWVSIEGFDESSNQATQVVKLPSKNVLDAEGLKRMLLTHGVNRSTPVPDFDQWKAGAKDE
jgi:hypothetical protein